MYQFIDHLKMQYEIKFEQAYVGKHFLRAKKEDPSDTRGIPRVNNKPHYKQKLIVVWWLNPKPTLCRMVSFINPKFLSPSYPNRILTMSIIRIDSHFILNRHEKGTCLVKITQDLEGLLTNIFT